MTGQDVTDLFLGCKTPLAEKGPVPRSAAPAATGIRVTNAAHGGKSNRIKSESPGPRGRGPKGDLVE